MLLNVEDNHAARYARTRVLRRAGFDVREAPTGFDAIQAAMDGRPQLVLLDVHLPDISGLEVCRRLKANPLTASASVLHISATARSEHDQLEAIESGADGFLVEPVPPAVLVSTVRVFMRARTVEAEQMRLLDQLRDANRRLTAHAGELARSKMRMERILEGITDGFLEIDRDWRFLQLNRSGAEHLGLNPEDVLGKGMWEVFPHAVGGVFHREYTEAFETGAPLHFEAQSQTTGRWFEVHVYPSGDRLAVYFRDITGRKRDQERMAELCRSAEEEIRARREMEAHLRVSNEELERFVYAVSHDLKEPLRTVLSFSQLTARRYREKLDPEGGEYIGHIVDSARRMQRMLEDLLGYARIIHHGTGEFGPVSMAAALDWALANLQESVRETGAEIETAELPTVSGDFSRLGQVWQNLVGNALKYRSEAPPRVEIEARRADDRWVFAVRDNGIGIDPEFHEAIFLAFKRLHGRSYPGTGLGLAISRKIIEQHGGRLWVESAAGRGATFYFSLPIG